MSLLQRLQSLLGGGAERDRGASTAPPAAAKAGVADAPQGPAKAAPDARRTQPAPEDVVGLTMDADCKAFRVHNGSKDAITNVRISIRKIKWCSDGTWVAPDEVPPDSLPVAADPLLGQLTTLAPNAKAAFRFVEKVGAAVTTGVHNKTNNQPIELTHHGEWRIVACAKWTDHRQASQRNEKEFEFTWPEGGTPLAKQ